MIEEGNPYYDSRNNCNAIIATGNNELLFGCKDTVIPNTVTSIRDDAFCGATKMKSIVIPSSVTSIGNYAFLRCYELESVIIPSSVISIGHGAFLHDEKLVITTLAGSCAENYAKENEIAYEIMAAHEHNYTYKYEPANATTKKNGQRIKYCTICYDTISTLDINYPKTVTLSSKSYVYDGKTKTPTITVTDTKGKSIDPKHYDVSMPTDSKAMGKYNCKVTFKGNYYTGSLNASYVIVPKTTGIESLQNATDGIMIKWKANTQATGYKILRSEDGTNFAAIKTIKDKSIVSYLDTGANENGKKYIYKIYAYNNAGGTTVTSAASTAKAIYRIDRPVISSITPVVGKIALEWKKIPSVSGYEIRYATDASFKENDNTIVIASETAYRKTITGLTSGKRYYFKIRAYKEVSGKKYYSAWSSAKSAVVK